MNVKITEETKTSVWFTVNDIIEILSKIFDYDTDCFRLEIDFAYERDFLFFSFKSCESYNKAINSFDLSKVKLEDIKNGFKKEG